MRRTITAAAVALIAAAAVPAESASPVVAQEPTAGAVTTSPQPTPAPQCVVTQREHRTYARKVYRRATVSKRARRELRRMRSCASTTKAARNMRAVERREFRARRARVRMRCGTPVCNRRLLVYMATRRYGRSGANCLVPIIAQESGFHHRKAFGGRIGPPGNTAWGLPQANPPQKMASAGPDWATNPATQIRWLFGYVDGRYGGPCGALSFKRANGTY